LRVVSYAKNGCFLSLGIDKDIFMPSNNPIHYPIDSSVFVYITTDKIGRLIAKKGIKAHLRSFKKHYARGQRVSIMPFECTDIGVGCVVENRFYGLIYGDSKRLMLDNKLVLGERGFGFIDKVREDGKIDIILYNVNLASRDAEIIFKTLNGDDMLHLCYDSSPEFIFSYVKMSKKVFKRALNLLVKNKKIEVIDKVGIKRLTL